MIQRSGCIIEKYLNRNEKLFQTLANDAWFEMISVHNAHKRDSTKQMGIFFERFMQKRKRQSDYYGGDSSGLSSSNNKCGKNFGIPFSTIAMKSDQFCSDETFHSHDRISSNILFSVSSSSIV